jgi:hypothetical protein
MRLCDQLTLERGRREPNSKVENGISESGENTLRPYEDCESYVRSDGLLVEVANLGMRGRRQSWLSKAQGR